MKILKNNCFIPDLGVAKMENFGTLYPLLNDYILSNREKEQSRAGDVKELLDVKTILTNPYRRCVGGYGRDINIFFLLAEAIWITAGQKDVDFLDAFNSRMKDFSDDGITFHAPYGFRLRHWGVRSDVKTEGGAQTAQGYDQVADAIRLFSENSNTRQVVLSIWNPSFDLGVQSKDVPCNDMVMLKIREGKLITTIQNRSNDLHWGLPTNIFQFSFLTEIMASCLGVELGTQTHNSQSLHIYGWNGIAEKMQKIYGISGGGHSLYEVTPAKEMRMDFDFFHELPINRFREIDLHLRTIIENIMKLKDGEVETQEEIEHLQDFSTFLYNTYQLLKIYIVSKRKIKEAKTALEKDAIRWTAISEIELLEAKGVKNWDVAILAKNFLYARLKETDNHEYLGKL